MVICEKTDLSFNVTSKMSDNVFGFIQLKILVEQEKERENYFKTDIPNGSFVITFMDHGPSEDVM